ncbi:uncharacterized protein CANTADRAFT_26932 [Suhomyces tanzawaensis NRRL Y-17324]|uniref:Uncharacterized protein n=1 Tax=Suhomyces tanzawaensis NRRL Y-17324 TaxID=984487 RepID=A0A1E4SEY1_9ASCO|nr:uncharacterized protein CANTADRAFT_26932 [Suhomyces tanzawaensis NRRL Y-17324]ODV77952.1 hypothetical protein CANTADRAFT_26932 [Suhomyces tanzawaensis NRRL Y-17324]
MTMTLNQPRTEPYQFSTRDFPKWISFNMSNITFTTVILAVPRHSLQHLALFKAGKNMLPV